jgi:hypothetical protein
MTQYEALHTQSLRITSDPNVAQETKTYVITTINPKLNRAHGIIVDYCTYATTGQAPSPDQITAALTEVIALFNSKHKEVK